jgi:hypothetical protein
MSMSFIEARLAHQSVPRAWETPVAVEQSFEKGALGSLVDGAFTEADDPAAGDVTHVSQTPFGASGGKYGASLLGRLEFPPGMAIVTEAFDTTFRAEFVGDLPALPGGEYGVVRDTDGRWKVDFDDAVGGVVRYLRPVSDLPGTESDELEEVFPTFVLREVEVEFVRP